LWGYLKSRVYAHNPLTLANLKETVKQEVAAIDCEMLDRPYTAFQQRVAFKKMDTTCLTLYFTDVVHFKWH
jgi:hypothetical protein